MRLCHTAGYDFGLFSSLITLQRSILLHSRSHADTKLPGIRVVCKTRNPSNVMGEF